MPPIATEYRREITARLQLAAENRIVAELTATFDKNRACHLRVFSCT